MIKEINHEEFIPVRMRVGCSKICDGVGLIAITNLPKNTLVADAVHLKETLFLPWKEFDKIDYASQSIIRDFCEQGDEGVYLPDDMNYLSVAWFMNHSCDGNVGYDQNGNFITMRDVNSGEELCYDYALAMTDSKYILLCQCGSENCRGKVTGNDWKDVEIMSKYKEYIHPAIRNEMKNN